MYLCIFEYFRYCLLGPPCNWVLKNITIIPMRISLLLHIKNWHTGMQTRYVFMVLGCLCWHMSWPVIMFNFNRLKSILQRRRGAMIYSDIVCFFGRKEKKTPLKHGNKNSYTDLNLKLEPTTSTNWRSTNWAIRRSDEPSLGIWRCAIFLTKFNHLYLGTGCVCFFLEGNGGNTP